jgi:hypothetical protein
MRNLAWVGADSLKDGPKQQKQNDVIGNEKENK